MPREQVPKTSKYWQRIFNPSRKRFVYTDDEHDIVIWNHRRGNSVAVSARILQRSMCSLAKHEYDKCGLVRSGELDGRKKKTMSAETKSKISAALTGKPKSDLHRNNMSVSYAAKRLRIALYGK